MNILILLRLKLLGSEVPGADTGSWPLGTHVYWVQLTEDQAFWLW